jgi:hypothetical protein
VRGSKAEPVGAAEQNEGAQQFEAVSCRDAAGHHQFEKEERQQSQGKQVRKGEARAENFVVVGGIVAQEKLFEFDQCHPYQADREEIMGPGFALSGINRHVEGAHSEK